jgi:hypothetical protein
LSKEDSLIVIWSSKDRDVALNTVFMYAHNAKRRGWWDDVRLIVWGPSSKLLTEDKELQNRIEDMIEDGVILEACKACADNYGVSKHLAELGINVYYIGQKLTQYIKEGRKIITF